MRRIPAGCSESAARMGFLYKLLFCLLFFFLIMLQCVFANEPPRPGEVDYLKQTGQFEERLNAARAIGNHLMDPDRLDQAIYRARREALLQQGTNPDAILPAPPSGLSLLPTKGNIKIFALLIDFLDYPGYSTRDQIQSALFGDGSLIPSNTFPTESLKNFYQRSSYGQLDFSSGVTLGWYHAPYNRSTVPMTTMGRENLIKEAISALGSSVDFSQFDNSGNGQIEYFLVIWTGPNNGWSNFWWGYQTSFSDLSYTINGKRLGKYSWQWEGYYGAYGPFHPATVIHETGHGLGLPDLYDYDATVGPKGGVGGLDMMDANWGDHNCFSKWVLDWLTPTVVGSGSQSFTLNPSGTSRDAVLITSGALSGNPFGEFFMIQNRYRAGNDSNVNYPADGMLIWHVDATLNSAGTSYQYNNSYSSHKLLKLVQADGLDRIEEASARADAAMYYQPGKTFGSTTLPSSKNYQGIFSRADVADIAQAWPQMSATFSIEDAGIGSILTVARAGVGSGTVTSDKSGIACGNDCTESYVKGDVITLTAVAAAGSVFTGWSGGGCSGDGTCVVALSSDTTVTAAFSSTLIINEDFDPGLASGPDGWSRRSNSGSGYWFFTYDIFNTSGGTGECALGAVASGSTGPPYDTELRTSALSLSSYTSVGIEFKTSLEASGETADLDVSVNGATGPWTNVWRKTGVFLGPQTVNVDLSSAAAGHDNVMLRFRLYGTSIWWVIDDIKVMASTGNRSPIVMLSTNNLNFGRQAIDTPSAAQSVTLTNSGTDTLSIGNIGVGGTNSGDFTQTNDCGSSLPIGGVCTIGVTFKPVAAGTRTASLTIGDNAAGSPHGVTLIGNGNSATTASTHHVFPQIADGYYGDGYFFQSTVVITNSNPDATSPNCTLQFHGLTIGGQSAVTFTLSGAYLYATPGNKHALQTGYASLECSSNVEAQLLYTAYSSAGTKISEATVFSSPSATSFRFVADERGGTQLGLGFANDSAQTGKYTINIYNSNATLIGSPQLTVDAGQNHAVYLDQLATIPGNYLGIVDVVSSSGTTSVIGLRYTGNLFTTVPAAIMSSTSASATTSTRHVFPQIADGYYGDSSYFQSTLIVTNSNPNSTPTTCTLQFHGLSIGGQSAVTFTLSGAYLLATPGSTQALQTGYASLLCSSNVEAQLLYTAYSRTGTKISEATVFSSPSATSLRIIADERGGTQLGFAVANDSTQTGKYAINIYDSNGNLIGSPQLTVKAGQNFAVFLDQLATIPNNYVGIVDIIANSGTASVIGLRYTGNLFTTVPATIVK